MEQTEKVVAKNRTFHGLYVTMHDQMVGRIEDLSLHASAKSETFRWIARFSQFNPDEKAFHDFEFTVKELRMQSGDPSLVPEILEVVLFQETEDPTKLPWGFK
jgi:hypothetical protein